MTLNATSATFSFLPTSAAQLGLYIIDATICDGEPQCSTYQFNVVFSNTAPVFSNTVPSSVNVHVGKNSTFTLPSYSDPDGDAVTISTYQDTMSTLPVYASYFAGVFIFTPTLWS